MCEVRFSLFAVDVGLPRLHVGATFDLSMCLFANRFRGENSSGTFSLDIKQGKLSLTSVWKGLEFLIASLVFTAEQGI